ncbi:hypothetical protein RISK_001080 [Rhodopirellula islandica]|uniref:Uncharacterized protein n=1 Tax=Rhodopirellula islandica TaxID=595434 RepID=A0A0J1BJN3_RHOIS|nr:hypothetical protein RISK_001080 [Rhodopirellula islandica]
MLPVVGMNTKDVRQLGERSWSTISPLNQRPFESTSQVRRNLFVITTGIPCRIPPWPSATAGCGVFGGVLVFRWCAALQRPPATV